MSSEHTAGAKDKTDEKARNETGKWKESYEANRAFKRVVSGEYKSMSDKTLARHKPHLTLQQINELEKISKDRKELSSRQKCRSDVGRPRTKSKTVKAEEETHDTTT
eukprot:2140934-Pleurochrysis_carterae.AAC.1